MSKRIILTSMSWEQNHGVTTTIVDDNSHYPIGLAYLHSYLESQGHIVKTIWLNNHYTSDIERITQEVINFKPDIVGFNVLTANRTKTFRAASILHQNNPDINIVFGGIHATLMYEQILKKYPYIVVIRGEGEMTFGELVSAISNKTDWCKVNGIAYSSNGEITVTPNRDLVQDLDTLPFPKHEIFFEGKREFACILTSRGCPNKCSFCCLNPTSPRKVRFRSVQNVMGEIEHLVKIVPNLKLIWIHDDSFFIDTKRAIAICDEIIKQNYNVSFVCSGRFKPITDELILKLEQAKFKTVLLGLESGNDNILKSCHKGITKDEVRRVASMFKSTKIELTMFLIVGLPGETEQTVKETYNFIMGFQKNKYMYYQDIGVLTVYPGTEVYEIMKQHNLITDDYWMTENLTPCYTVDHTFEELMAFKEDTLNHISLDRITTWGGLKNQWCMIPHIVKYIITYKRDNIKRRLLKLLSLT